MKIKALAKMKVPAEKKAVAAAIPAIVIYGAS
jgi:hypothetical protein